jgi:hypothetical protein
MQDIPYIKKLPENFEIKKEDIIYVHRADPNRKMEYHFEAPTLKLESEEFLSHHEALNTKRKGKILNNVQR